jgi:cell surface protein SprA
VIQPIHIYLAVWVTAMTVSVPANAVPVRISIRYSADSTDSNRVDLDTLDLDFGDPTNTDVPSFLPPSKTNRKPLSPLQKYAPSIDGPAGYQRTSRVDSLITSVRLSESIDGLDVGTQYQIGLDDYLTLRRNELHAELRDSSLYTYELKKPMSEGELIKLLDQATNIKIPLPQSPIFSIFGTPEISINVNGEVNVRAGWRWDTQNLGTASVLGQTQSSPIFDQNIQVNVNARIGDKFRFNVDWNTLNQFEFNNRFKVGYEGYDDDIIKRVEFGNVNLQTESSLIGGGQTLFGVRADFQFGPLYLKTIASQRRGERRFINAQGGSSKQFFTIRAYDYARNHFFVDTAYMAVWRPCLAGWIRFIGDQGDRGMGIHE